MSKEAYLQGYTKEELLDIARVSFRSGNYFTLERIEKVAPGMFAQRSKFFKDYNPVFDVCYKGNTKTLEFIQRKNQQLLHLQDPKGNSCLHYAAKGGNTQVITIST